MEKMKTPGKPWYKSKELGTLFVSFVALFIQERFGWVVPPQIQGYGLLGIMFLLRWVTKEPIKWEIPNISITKKFIVILMLMLMLVTLTGCKTMLSVCKSLGADVKMMDQIIIKAREAHMRDPNHITNEHLDTLEDYRDDLMIRASTACMLNEIIPLD